jgi:DNA-binding transcriptional ArsR family regulator
MVNNSAALDSIFAALSDSTRRGILEALAAGEAAVSDLARPFAMSLPAIVKHLRVLERAGLVHTAKTGRVRRVGIEAAPLRTAAEWIETYRIFWGSNLDSLAEYLEKEQTPKTKEKHP